MSRYESSPDWAQNMFGESIGVEAYGYLVRENQRKRLAGKAIEGDQPLIESVNDERAGDPKYKIDPYDGSQVRIR